MANIDHTIAGSRQSRAYDTPHLGELGLALFASLFVLSLTVEPLAMMLAGGLLLSAGFLLAALQWLFRRRGEGASSGRYDVAGLLVFLGFAASVIANADLLLS